MKGINYENDNKISRRVRSDRRENSVLIKDLGDPGVNSESDAMKKPVIDPAKAFEAES